MEKDGEVEKERFVSCAVVFRLSRSSTCALHPRGFLLTFQHEDVFGLS